MFVGAVNTEARGIIAETAAQWKGRPVYVGCSGNFTIERVLARAGIKELHGNDVTLYSCYLGSYLAGQPIELKVRDEGFAWLEDYLRPGPATVAALLLLGDILGFASLKTPYHVRMFNEYTRAFPDLHARTVEQVEKALEGLRLTSFIPGDVVEFAQAVPPEAVFISFPPTYAGGYEKQYRLMNEVIAWTPPAYTKFDENRFLTLVETVRARDAWMFLTDRPIEPLAGHLRSVIQNGMRSRPTFIYATEAPARLVGPHQKTEPVPLARLDGQITGPVEIVRLTQGQMNTLRSEYLSPGIVPASARLNLGVTAGGKLIGALAFDVSQFPWVDAYMMTDFAIRPTPYPRLSKLVLAMVLTTELRDILEQSLKARIHTIGTTAFTERQASMKYRGLFDLHSRKDGRLNYIAQAGQWTAEEAFDWWQTKHGQTLSD